MLVGAQVATKNRTRYANNKSHECRLVPSIKMLEVKTANDDAATQVCLTGR
jgi:hypothetical protein